MKITKYRIPRMCSRTRKRTNNPQFHELDPETSTIEITNQSTPNLWIFSWIYKETSRFLSKPKTPKSISKSFTIPKMVRWWKWMDDVDVGIKLKRMMRGLIFVKGRLCFGEWMMPLFLLLPPYPFSSFLFFSSLLSTVLSLLSSPFLRFLLSLSPLTFSFLYLLIRY